MKSVNQNQKQRIKCKVVLLGDTFVGKSSIIYKFTDPFQINQLKVTLTIDFVHKTINVDDKQLTLTLWDTVGQQRYFSLIPTYLKDCSAAVIVFDLTNPNSFDNLGKWIDVVKQIRGEETLIMVIGNKADLKTDAEQNFSQNARKKLKTLGLMYMEVSAKTGQNIDRFFVDILGKILLENYLKQIENKKVNEQKILKTPKRVRQTSIPNTNAKSIKLSDSRYQEESGLKVKRRCC